MFRTFSRLFLPNKLDAICQRAVRRSAKKILIAWNRGLGDIALGLYAVVQRIREHMPDAQITFLIRPDLQEGFTLLEGVRTILAPAWVRGEPYDVGQTLHSLDRSCKEFDLIIPYPSPTDWVRWQIGSLTPRLVWNSAHDGLSKKFDLADGFVYIGVQTTTETDHGPWRNWPSERWLELFRKLGSFDKARIILFGNAPGPRLDSGQIIDLRGKTALLEMLSIIKNHCRHLIVPDSGILSIVYYLDAAFPLQIISLWSDPKQGVLKQNVASPNPMLAHRPLIGAHRDLSNVSAGDVFHHLSSGFIHAK